MHSLVLHKNKKKQNKQRELRWVSGFGVRRQETAEPELKAWDK